MSKELLYGATLVGIIAVMLTLNGAVAYLPPTTPTTTLNVMPTEFYGWTSGSSELYTNLNVTCPYYYKIDWGGSPSMDGVYPIENSTGTTVANLIISNDDGKFFNWNLTGVVNEKTIGGVTYDVEYFMCYVAVKAGRGAYVYNYTMMNAEMDTRLYAYDDKDISHAVFGFREVLTPREATTYCYETAYGKGAGAVAFTPRFSNWGWTNYVPGYGEYTFELWAGAAQCDTSKGIMVGTVTVTYGPGSLNVAFHVNSPYVLSNELGEEETHVYAGSSMFPTITVKGTLKATVAPGQYRVCTSDLNGNPIYVILHAVVGIPCN
ncbi:MAG: hypothetical protein QFX33_00420 [Candidatus Nezhaarchaeota archaeon]|nr:hypothetical protein [Candidatus Nezhaarchaeota archaeon]